MTRSAATWTVLAMAAVLAGCSAAKPGASLVVPVDSAVQNDPLARQLGKDPLTVLQRGLDWYDANVRDYTCKLHKKERLDPAEEFDPEQVLDCKFRETPFSVATHTIQNVRGAEWALYVEGKYAGKMLAHTGGLLPLTLRVEPRSPTARRYTLRFIDQFGFKRGLANILDSLTLAQGEGILKLGVLGAGQIGGRDVVVLDSVITKPDERFEYPHIRVYLDREWKLPLGVDTWDAAGVDRGRYRFTEIKLNVGLADADFTPAACFK